MNCCDKKNNDAIDVEQQDNNSQECKSKQRLKNDHHHPLYLPKMTVPKNVGPRLSISALSIISSTKQNVCNRVKDDTHLSENNNNWNSALLPILLCFYSMLKEIKVGEPYLYKYQTEYMNLTVDQITGEVYPYTPYTYMVALVPIFLLTDLLLYKPTMLTEVLGQVGFRATLVFGTSVTSQQMGQIFYGLASASEVAFFSYIYARLEKDQYRRLTSWTRAGTMAGRSIGYLFAQFLILTHLGNLYTLNFIAFVMPCIVLFFCIGLPRVHWKLMVGRMLGEKGRIICTNSSVSLHHLPKTYGQYAAYRLYRLRSDFVKIYRVGHIRKWSLWWAMTTAMSLQVALFSQTLWGEVQKEDNGESPLNGFAEASYTATATAAIIAMNAFPLDWDRWGELALVLISSLDAAMLVLYSQTQSIWVMYGCYIGYRSLYQVMITIAQWNIAKKMVCESYGLVFGVNSFIALAMQSIVTAVITDKHGLGMHVRHQYLVYAIMHAIIALIFFISVLITFACSFYTKCKLFWDTNQKNGSYVVSRVHAQSDLSNCSSNENGKNDENIWIVSMKNETKNKRSKHIINGQ